MPNSEPFFREAGTGPGVVCLHANASTCGQWRAFMERLAPKFRVLALDSYGSGKSPEWPSDREIALRDELAFIEPVLERAGSRIAVAGHSYGGAIALIAALSRPDQIRALAVYEPTLFALVDAESPPPNDADGIRNAVADAVQALEADDKDSAAKHFIDYWMGTGSWARMSHQQKAPIADSVRNVRRWAHALFTEPTPLSAFRSLDIPVLYMLGERSTRSAHAVADLLTGVLPDVEVVEFKGLGHMGAVTHAEQVNQAIEGFLGRVAPRLQSADTGR